MERRQDDHRAVTVHIRGRPVRVPFGLTLMKAMEFAGFRPVRGIGCRGGFCGACATLYKTAGDYKLRPALACQKTVEDGMILASVPLVPALRASHDVGGSDPRAVPTLLVSRYPEVARCVVCNTCSKACPQDLPVMDIIQLALREDLEGVARESFDCIQCGLCAMRCPADIPHQHLTQLARRVHARHQVAPSAQLRQRVAEIEAGTYRSRLDRLVAMDVEELRRRYDAREVETA